MDPLANALLHLLDPLLFACWALLLVAVALVRRRPRVALAVGGRDGAGAADRRDCSSRCSPIPTRSRPATTSAGASWPSGHSTAALALVLCAVLVAPVRLRPTVAALGGAFAVAVGCSLLILAWHMPSDVFGGYLVRGAVDGAGVAGLRAAERRRLRSLRRSGAAAARELSAVRARVPQ